MALFLDEEDVRRLVDMGDALEAVEEAFRHAGEGRAVNEPRRRLASPMGGLQLLPALDAAGGIAGLKINAGRGGGFCLLFDLATGEALAVIRHARLGQLRTGAASGVATKYLARSQSQVLGVIGTGYQARTQVEAVCAVRPIRRVLAYSRDPERRRAFATRMQESVGVEVVPASSAEEAVQAADVVCTITNSAVPVLRGEWLAAGVHVNAAGSNSLLRQEIDDSVVERSALVAVDDVAQVELEGGDLLRSLQRGIIGRAALVNLGEIVAGRKPGRATDQEVTLFKSHGIGLEDVALAGAIYRKAREQGAGREISL